MILLEIIFWFSLFIVFYSYLGYGIILWIYLKIKGNGVNAAIIETAVFEPEVTLIVATFNEEIIIQKKIENTLSLDYPASKRHIIIIGDGSTDRTMEIAAQFTGIQLLYKPEREGKVAAINRAMQYVKTPFVIFSDANTILNTECIREIVKHYKDPGIGAVAGEKKVIDPAEKQNAAGAGEGLYWKYESILKVLDSRFYTVVGAAGELFSIRTSLFEPVGNDILLDDFIMSMKICRKGYRVMYEPLAYAAEAPSLTMKDERKRKVRISAGGFQSVIMLRDLLNIFKYGKLSFQYISHRVLRWVVCPVLLPVILIANLILSFYSLHTIYDVILLLQVLFYIAAFAGWMLAIKNIKSRIFYIPYYFVFMNFSLYTGFIRFKKKTQTVLWDKAKRKM